MASTDEVARPASADELLALLVEVEEDARPGRIRFDWYQAMGTGTVISTHDRVVADAAEQDVEDLADDGYVKIRGDYLDLTDAGRERARLLDAASELDHASSPPASSDPRSADETWSWRELPFLRAALPLVDAGAEPGTTALAEVAGITQAEARAAAAALEGSFPPFITMRWMPQGGGGPPQHGMVIAVHDSARRALGAWPSAETLVDQLAAALLAAAERAEDPNDAEQLREAAGDLGTSVVKGVLVNLLTKGIVGLTE